MKIDTSFMLSEEEKNDKIDCFARISKVSCNALKKKKCYKCNFYKSKNEVPNYKHLLNKKNYE